MRAVVVGELNPYSADPADALHPRFPGAAGSRLASILGLSQDAYLSALDRVNLCEGVWELAAARRVAAAVVARWRVAVLLGRRVCGAFDVPFKPFQPFELDRVVRGRLATLRGVVLPHPSGLCRVWNDPENARAARVAVAPLLGGVR